MYSSFLNIESGFLLFVTILTPLVSIIRVDLRNEILKYKDFQHFAIYFIFIFVYITSRVFLAYTIYFMLYFLNGYFEGQKIIAILTFGVLDTLFWILIKSISKRSKQVLVFQYLVAYLVESIIMLPFSMILVSFAMSFAF